MPRPCTQGSINPTCFSPHKTQSQAELPWAARSQGRGHWESTKISMGW